MPSHTSPYPYKKDSHSSHLSYTPLPPSGRTSPPRTHEKSVPRPAHPRQKYPPPRLGHRCTHSPVLRLPPLAHPTPLYGSREVCGRQDTSNASGKELPGSGPLIVRRGPRLDLPPMRNGTRNLHARDPDLPRLPTGPRPPAETCLLPGARRNNMVRPPPHRSTRRVYHRHANRFPPGHDPRPLLHPFRPPSPRLETWFAAEVLFGLLFWGDCIFYFPSFNFPCKKRLG